MADVFAQTLVVQEDEDGKLPDIFAVPVRLVKPDGTPVGGGKATVAWADVTDKPATFPAAPPAWADVTGKPATYPVVKAAVTPSVKAADATAPTATSVAAAGEAPTKAEFDAVVTQCAELKTTVAALVALANESKTAVNSLITTTRAAGLASDR